MLFELRFAIVFIMDLLGGRDEVEHVSPDEQAAQFAKIAVGVVLDFGDAPGVLASLDVSAVVRQDVLCGANHREWHGGHDVGVALGGCVVVAFDQTRVHLDVLCCNHATNLIRLLREKTEGECR